MLKFSRRNKRLVIPVGINPNYGIDKADLYNTNDADVVANDVLEGKIAYGKDGKIIGTLDVQGEIEESYQEGYEFGYDEGNEAGYRLGYDEGKDDGIEEQKAKLEGITITENGSYNREDGWNSVVVDVPDLNGDYNEGVEAGIEIGKAEIIEGMNDATITAGTVFKGEIGYGKNNERVVGEFEYVEGFNFGKIGYSQTLSNELNSDTATKLAYSKQLYDAWDPSRTSARNLYNNDSQLVYAPLIDTSNVTDMGYMLYKCSSLEILPDYNYDNVTNMERFCGYSNNTTLTLNLKACTNAAMMCAYNNKIERADINFNNLECNCYALFYDCSGLTTVEISNVINSGTSMFYGCTNASVINLYNFQTTNCSDMFNGCKSLTSVPEFDTSNITNMYQMFNGCSSLTSVPEFDTSKVTNMSYTFNGCKSLTSVPEYNASSITGDNRYGACLFGTSSLSSTRLNSLTDFGGLLDLGKSYGSVQYNEYKDLLLHMCQNLTYESCMNVINKVYDLNLNIVNTIVPNIKFAATAYSLLSDDDIAIATNKGWSIISA